jgi:hypothetical protein
MSLIAREELQLKCRETGYSLVSEVLNEGSDISDERMDEIFEPLIESVEARTRDAVQSEMDELRGQMDDRCEENERQDIISERRASIRDKCILFIDDEPQIEPPLSIFKSVAQYEPAWLDIDDADDDELMECDEDDERWDDYREHYTINFDSEDPDSTHLKAIFKMMLNYNTGQIIPYAETHGISIWTMRDYLTKLEDMGITTFIFRDFKQTLDCVKATDSRTCQRIIYAGVRKGSICARRIHRNGKCRYHLKRST